MKETTDAVRAKLDDLGFAFSLKHWDQAVSAFDRGEWESANGQLRTFFESFWEQVAAKLLWPENGPQRGSARKVLEERGFLSDIEAGLVRALVAVLSGEGSHPGHSNEADCRRRFGMVAGMAELHASRLQEQSQDPTSQLEKQIESVFGRIQVTFVSTEFEHFDFYHVSIDGYDVAVRMEGSQRYPKTIDDTWVRELEEYFDRWDVPNFIVVLEGEVRAPSQCIEVDSGVFQIVHRWSQTPVPQPRFVAELPAGHDPVLSIQRLVTMRDLLGEELKRRQ